MTKVELAKLRTMIPEMRRVRRIHFIGIGGAGMGGIAEVLANEGYQISGSDIANNRVTEHLASLGADIQIGHKTENVQGASVVVVSTAIHGDNPEVIAAREQRIPVVRRAEMLAELMRYRHGIAVAGTHGKTTTTTMLAWVLDQAGLNPGFLIGGVPLGFSESARLGGGKYFCVEADEYDSAFFDKRSKFVHYHPKTAILNNLEFDHADIFDDLAAIQKQFHHLVRTIPSEGRIIAPITETNIDEVLEQGCWTPVVRTSLEPNDQAALSAELISADGSHFNVLEHGQVIGEVKWNMTGQHSVANALATIAAAQHVGVTIEQACEALSNFGGVKRRMELLGTVRGIEVYDDFAHHPTAIETTLDGARKRLGERKLWAIIEPRSNTMRMGSHKDGLAHSARLADEVIWYQPEGLDWDLQPVISASANKAEVSRSLDDIIARVVNEAGEGDAVVIMSNGGFGGLHQKLITALS